MIQEFPLLKNILATYEIRLQNMLRTPGFIYHLNC